MKHVLAISLATLGCLALFQSPTLAEEEKPNTIQVEVSLLSDLSATMEISGATVDLKKCSGTSFYQTSPGKYVSDTIQPDDCRGEDCVLEQLSAGRELMCDGATLFVKDVKTKRSPKIHLGSIPPGLGSVWLGPPAWKRLFWAPSLPDPLCWFEPHGVKSKRPNATAQNCRALWDRRGDVWIGIESTELVVDAATKGSYLLTMGSTTLDLPVQPCDVQVATPLIAGAKTQALVLRGCVPTLQLIAQSAGLKLLDSEGANVAASVDTIGGLDPSGVSLTLGLTRVRSDVTAAMVLELVSDTRSLTKLSTSVSNPKANLTRIEYLDPEMEQDGGGPPATTPITYAVTSKTSDSKKRAINVVEIELPDVGSGNAWSVGNSTMPVELRRNGLNDLTLRTISSTHVVLKFSTPLETTANPVWITLSRNTPGFPTAVEIKLADASRTESIPVKLASSVELDCGDFGKAKTGDSIAPRSAAQCTLMLRCPKEYGLQTILIEQKKISGDPKQVSASVQCRGAAQDEAAAVPVQLGLGNGDNDPLIVTARIDVAPRNSTYRRGQLTQTSLTATDPNYTFSATIRTRTSLAPSWDMRISASVPVAPLAVRAPASRARLKRSSSEAGYEIATLETGLLLNVEPWDYATRTNGSSPPIKLSGGVLLVKKGDVAVSTVVGPSIVLPLVDSPSQLGTTLSLSAFWEWDAVTKQHHGLLAVSLDLLSITP